MLFCDFATLGQKSFQDPATPVMESIIGLHHTIFFFLVVIFCFVVYMLVLICIKFNLILSITAKRVLSAINLLIRNKTKDFNTISSLLGSAFNVEDIKKTSYFKKEKFEFISTYSVLKKWTHQAQLEIVWTVIPSLILISIAVPSFVLLYALDAGAADPFCIIVKVVGHQWYWSYQFLNVDESLLLQGSNFDSYMISNEVIQNTKHAYKRLLDTDNALWLPLNRYVRLIITSVDVIHSWAVPSLGVKVDAIPGRLNQTFVLIKRPGIFYGQCSEICGVNHAFMPIKVVANDIFGVV